MKSDEKLDQILKALEGLATDVTAVKATTEETAVVTEAVATKVGAELPPAPGPTDPKPEPQPEPPHPHHA